VDATLRYRLDSSWPIGLPDGMSGVSAVAFEPMYQEVYVLQRGKQLPPVVVFDTVGHIVRTWGGINEARMFEKEHGLYIQSNQGDPIVWITDSANCTVQSFDVFGTRLNLLGDPGVCDNSTEPLHFGNVADVASDFAGNIYISDGDGGVNNRVVKLDSNLRLVWSVGKLGTGPGEFHSPHSLAYQGGRLWVADRENNRTQVLDANGLWVREYDHCEPHTPWAVRVTSNNLLFVVDAGYQPGPPTQGRLIVFQSDYQNCTAVSGIEIGTPSSEPHGLGYDEDTLSVYVAFINDLPFISRYVPTTPP